MPLGASTPSIVKEGAQRRPFSRFPLLVIAMVALTGCLVGDPGPMSRWNASGPRAESRVTRGLAYGPLPTQRFDLYASTSRMADGRTIVFFHGGGWSGGSRADVPPLVLDLARDGWNIVSASYRLTCSAANNPLCTSARFSEQIADVKLAVRYVKAHARELGVSATRVVIAGYSAGGHLATIAALSAGAMEPPDEQMDAPTRAMSSSVAGYVNFNGPTDIATALRSHDRVGDSYLAPAAAALFRSCVVQADRTAVCDPREVAAASVAMWIDPADPPGYVFMGGADTLVPASTHGAPLEEAATAVSGDHGRVWLDVAEAGGHDAFTLVNYRSLREWLRRTVP